MGYTLQQLQQMGAKPVGASSATLKKKYTFEELKQLGAKPKEESFRYQTAAPKPLTSQEKIAKYQEEQVGYDADLKKNKSVLGFLGNAVKADALTSSPFVGGAVKTAKIVNKIIDKPTNNNQEKYNRQLIDRNYELVKIIKEKEKAGKDASADKKEYNQNQDQIDQHKKDVDKSNAEMPTNKQAVGALAQTGLDVLSVGTYGKATQGMNSFSRATGSPSIIPKNPKMFSLDTAKDVAVGAGYGAGYGSTEAAYNKSETPVKDTILATLIGAAIPVVLKAPGAIKGHHTKDPTTGISPKMEKGYRKVEKEIAKVENGYKKLRKVDQNPKRVEARKLLAKTGWLDDAIDADGKIRTTTKGGVVSKIDDTIEPYEKVVSDAIKNEGITLDKNIIKKKIINVIENSTITGEARGSALSRVSKEVDGLRLSSDGKIDLSEIQAGKIFKTRNVDYNNPLNKEYDKAVAKAYRELVEANTKTLDAGKTNEALSKLYAVRELAEDLDGMLVKGGRLGRYVGAGLGAAIGGGAGSIGGPVAGAVGAATGADLGYHLVGRNMSKRFKGPGGVGLAIPKELQAAKKIVEAGTRKLKVKSLPSEYTNDLPTIAFGAKAKSKYLKVNKNLPTAYSKRSTRQTTIKAINKSNPKLISKSIPQTTKKVNSVHMPTKKSVLDKLKSIPNKQGGFVRVPGSNAKDKVVLKKASDFLDNWTGTNSPKGSKSSLKKMSPQEIDELATFFNKKFPPTNKGTVTLYRGIEKGQGSGLQNRPTSWTYSREVAKEHTYGTGKVKKIKVKADQILLDTTSMPPGLAKGHGFILDEEEVILKPKVVKGFLEKLKTTYKNTPNKQGGFIKIGNTTVKEVSEQTKKELVEAVDYLRLGKSGNKNIESNLEKLLQKYKVNPDQSNTKIADTLQDLIEKTKTKSTPRNVLQPYKGEKDLTTKILKDLEGKTTVSKQYILDATNRGELKQVERDLVRNMLKGEGDSVNVAKFAKKVKAELLPLKVESSARVLADDKGSVAGRFTPGYEHITLPKESRGQVAQYSENIYRSPIKTNAGDVHFRPAGTSSKNYFGHTRIEDMADDHTRRVIEVQSDLYQKGRLESEFDIRTPKEAAKVYPEIIKDKKAFSSYEKDFSKRMKDKAKLQQYNDPTAHFRMVREEIKKAAQDGKTKLQFPTGETAMKIEGLGEIGGGVTPWAIVRKGRHGGPDLTLHLKSENMKVGQTISRMGDPEHIDDWIITDVLGDGKFKAVPKNFYDMAFDGSRKFTSEASKKQYLEQSFGNRVEEFDISGKVDTNNPIYRFYEKDIQKYLQKFGGHKIIDSKGVSWIEVPLKKEMGDEAVEAFGKIGLGPLFGGAALGSLGVLSANLKKKDEK